MATAPTAPKIFIRPDAVAPNQLDFYWGPPSSDGGSAITSYILQMTAPSTFTQVIPAPQDVTSVYNLVDGTQYTFTLTASNSIGSSPAATFRSVYVGTEPGVIGDMGVIPINETTHEVRWTRSFGDGFAPITYHAIHSFPADVNGSTIQGTTSTIVTPAFANQYSATIFNLDSNISYVHLPQAINDPGYSPATSFTPAISTGSLAVSTTRGLQTWLDADGAVGTVQAPGNSTIIGWNDSGLLGNNVTGVVNASNLKYDADSGSINSIGGTTGFTLDSNILPNDNSDYSMVYVFNTQQNTYQTIYEKGGTNITYWDNLQESLYVPNIDNYLYGIATPANTNIITQIDYNSNVVTMYRNGSLASTFTGAYDRTDGTSSNAKLMYGDTHSANLRGNLSEFMLFNRNISEYERNSISQYLGRKYTIYPYYDPPYNNFQPTEIAGLRLWLDANDPTTFTFNSGSNIATWSDKSAYANDATGSTSPYPTYNGSNRVYVDNASFFSLPDDTIPGGNTPFTVFFILNATLQNSPIGFWGTNNLVFYSEGVDIYRYLPTLRINDGTADINITAPGDQYAFNDTFIYTFSFTPGNADIYVNNEFRNQAIIPSRVSSGSNTVVGSISGYNPLAIGSYMQEMIVYDSRLNERDMNTVYNYLRKKYFS